MSTPDGWYIPPVDAESLALVLEDVAQRQRERTASISFGESQSGTPYKSFSIQQHHALTSRRLDKLRKQISDWRYWKYEARHFFEEFCRHIWENECKRHNVEASNAFEPWRDLSQTFRRRLKTVGLSAQQIEECRLAIDDKSYWKPESEHLQWRARQREPALRELAKKKCLRREAMWRRANKRTSGGAPRPYDPWDIQPVRRSLRIAALHAGNASRSTSPLL